MGGKKCRNALPPLPSPFEHREAGIEIRNTFLKNKYYLPLALRLEKTPNQSMTWREIYKFAQIFYVRPCFSPFFAKRRRREEESVFGTERTVSPSFLFPPPLPPWGLPLVNQTKEEEEEERAPIRVGEIATPSSSNVCSHSRRFPHPYV